MLEQLTEQAQQSVLRAGIAARLEVEIDNRLVLPLCGPFKCPLDDGRPVIIA